MHTYAHPLLSQSHCSLSPVVTLAGRGRQRHQKMDMHTLTKPSVGKLLCFHLTEHKPDWYYESKKAENSDSILWWSLNSKIKRKNLNTLSTSLEKKVKWKYRIYCKSLFTNHSLWWNKIVVSIVHVHIMVGLQSHDVIAFNLSNSTIESDVFIQQVNVCSVKTILLIWDHLFLAPADSSSNTGCLVCTLSHKIILSEKAGTVKVVKGEARVAEDLLGIVRNAS